MLSFINLTIFTGNEYITTTDDTLVLADELLKYNTSINTVFIMRVTIIGDNEYSVDIGKLSTDYNIPIDTTIKTLLSGFITPEMIFTYHDPVYGFNRYLRTLNFSDVPGTLTIDVFNILTDEVSPYFDHPSYMDLRIASDGYNLDKMIPILDNKLRFCLWTDEAIYLPDSGYLSRSEHVEFLLFGAVDNVTLSRLSDLASYTLPLHATIMLVVQGKLFYMDDRAYTYDRTSGQLVISDSIVNIPTFIGYTKDELISDPDTYVIILDCNNIYYLQETLVEMMSNVSTYMNDDATKHINHICVDRSTKELMSLTIVDNKHRMSSAVSDEHHAYTDISTTNLDVYRYLVI
jgi:hypothetical protein